MTPEEWNIGVTWSAQLIGLLSVWKAERKSGLDSSSEDFHMWLASHNFNAISDRIYESDEVQRELSQLLAGSLDKIDEKITRMESLLATVASRVEGLQEVDRAASEDTGALSTQAREILKIFADSGDNRMILIADHHEPRIFLLPSQTAYTFDDGRFLVDDVEKLEEESLIHLHSYNNSGSPIYNLTREGQRLADELPDVEINAPSGDAAAPEAGDSSTPG